MKKLLLFMALSLVFINAKETFAQGNPCPCDCNEILSSDYYENQLFMKGTGPQSDCYTLDLKLKACGNRTIMGFSFTMPTPNCFEGKRVNIKMDNEDLGIIDLGNTTIPTYFNLETPISPCTERIITFVFCFPDGNGGDCINEALGQENSYDIGLNYQFGPGDPPCETQNIKMWFDYPIVMSVAKSYTINEVFIIENNELILKNNFNSDHLIVFDLEGKNVISTSSNKLNLTNLKSGAYFIVVKDGNNYIKTTYIKEN